MKTHALIILTFLNLQWFNGVLALQQSKQANSYVIGDAEAVFADYIGKHHIMNLKVTLLKQTTTQY